MPKCDMMVKLLELESAATAAAAGEGNARSCAAPLGWSWGGGLPKHCRAPCGLTLGSCASKVAIVLVDSKLGRSHDLIAARIVLQDCARLPLHSWRGSDSTLLVHLRNLHFIQRCAYTWQAMRTVKRADAQPDSAATVSSTQPPLELLSCMLVGLHCCPVQEHVATFVHHSDVYELLCRARGTGFQQAWTSQGRTRLQLLRPTMPRIGLALMA